MALRAITWLGFPAADALRSTRPFCASGTVSEGPELVESGADLRAERERVETEGQCVQDRRWSGVRTPAARRRRWRPWMHFRETRCYRMNPSFLRCTEDSGPSDVNLTVVSGWSPEDHDTALRLAAWDHVRLLRLTREHLTAAELRPGFVFQGRRIPLINPQRGIFKPAETKYLLSIRTVFPRPGRKIWYDDQRRVHSQIFDGDEAVDYAFMGTDPTAPDNRWLREAMENGIPVIYFLGIAPGRYEPFLPTVVVGWDPQTLKARIVFGDAAEAGSRALEIPATAMERRYALTAVKQRLHQAVFREAVIAAYSGRCAVSGLPEPLLLDAAHIIEDRNEQLGQPIVPNGIPLSKIHHAAFDAHLIGVDPDYHVHVSERLLAKHDGPMLEALKHLEGSSMWLPARVKDRPDSDRLALRFEQFKKTK
jgi:putative restriction endonuclease